MAASSTPHHDNLVAYYRVSTKEQGESGLGLDAQRAAVERYLNGFQLLAEFTEVESGKRSDNRPQLTAALALCRRKKATLLISKLDRLSRNVAFIATMLESKVRFKCCDMPEADRTFLQMLAVFAEYERKRIGERTKEGLAAAKAKGTRLGNPNLAAIVGMGAAKNREKAEQFAANVLPVIAKIEHGGALTLRAVAAELTARGIRTPSGNDEWNQVTVSKIKRRAATMEQAISGPA